MVIFTAIGVLWFWMLCFEVGYGIAWLADKGWLAVVAVFDALLGIRDVTAAVVMASIEVGGDDAR